MLVIGCSGFLDVVFGLLDVEGASFPRKLILEDLSKVIFGLLVFRG